jgi:integrase/recombinase XerD
MRKLPLNQLHESLAEEFMLTLKALGYNRGRESSPAILIREFLFFLESLQIEDVRKCRRKEIGAFFIYISERQNQRRIKEKLSENYISKFMYSVSKFFDFLLDSNEIEALPAHISKFYPSKKNEREILSEEEIMKLYNNCKTPLEKAILALGYGCGLRRSEMVALRIRDIIFKQDIVIVRDGKNHKNRTIPISDSVKKDLFEYLKIRSRKPKTFTKLDLKFFYSTSIPGTNAHGNILNNKLKNLIRRTFEDSPRMKKISLHSLRTSIAVHLINRSAEITLVQRFLGHSSIDSTHLYIKRRLQRSNIQNMLWSNINRT